MVFKRIRYLQESFKLFNIFTFRTHWNSIKIFNNLIKNESRLVLDQFLLFQTLTEVFLFVDIFVISWFNRIQVTNMIYELILLISTFLKCCYIWILILFYRKSAYEEKIQYTISEKKDKKANKAHVNSVFFKQLRQLLRELKLTNTGDPNNSSHTRYFLQPYLYPVSGVLRRVYWCWLLPHWSDDLSAISGWYRMPPLWRAPLYIWIGRSSRRRYSNILLPCQR